MKKLISLIACLAASVATAASISNDDYLYNKNGTSFALEDAATFAADGNFAFFIDLGTPLYQAGVVDFAIGFGESPDGPGVSLGFTSSPDLKIAFDEQFNFIDAPNGVFAVSFNGKTITKGYETEIQATTLLFQVHNLFSDAPTASVSYFENDSLFEIYSAPILPNANGLRPTTVNVAQILIRSEVVTMNEEQGVSITTWKGEVTADDIKNPTYLEPAPSVPEPATATLSLLALAGLAARRRRK